jgi:hypothetical protein
MLNARHGPIHNHDHSLGGSRGRGGGGDTESYVVVLHNESKPAAGCPSQPVACWQRLGSLAVQLAPTPPSHA